MINQQLMQQILMSINASSGREIVQCTPCFTVSRVCVFKPVYKAVIVLLVKLGTLHAWVCACGQLVEDSALPWKYRAKHTRGGDWGAALSTTWGFLLFGSDSRAGFSLISLHTCPPVFLRLPFSSSPSLHLLEFPEASLPLTGSPFNSNASNRPWVCIPLKTWFLINFVDRTIVSVISVHRNNSLFLSVSLLHLEVFFGHQLARTHLKSSLTGVLQYGTNSTPDTYTHSYKELSRYTANIMTMTCCCYLPQNRLTAGSLLCIYSPTTGMSKLNMTFLNFALFVVYFTQ